VSARYGNGHKSTAVCQCALYGVIIVLQSISVRDVLDDYCNVLCVSVVSTIILL